MHSDFLVYNKPSKYFFLFLEHFLLDILISYLESYSFFSFIILKFIFLHWLFSFFFFLLLSHWLAAIDQWKCCIDSYANKIWVSKHSSKDDCPNQILITTLYFLWQDLQNKTAFNYTSIIFFYVIICSKKVYFARNILFCYWNICFVPRRISIFAKNLLFCWNMCVSSEHFKKFKTFFWTFLAIIQNIVSCSHTFFTSQSNGTFWNIFKQIL